MSRSAADAYDVSQRWQHGVLVQYDDHYKIMVDDPADLNPACDEHLGAPASIMAWAVLNVALLPCNRRNHVCIQSMMQGAVSFLSVTFGHGHGTWDLIVTVCAHVRHPNLLSFRSVVLIQIHVRSGYARFLPLEVPGLWRDSYTNEIGFPGIENLSKGTRRPARVVDNGTIHPYYGTIYPSIVWYQG